jgi:phosphate-selective porin
MWDLNGTGPASIGADQQEGGYLETSYKFNPKIGMFVRYSEWDNTAGDTVDSKKEQWNVGLNYWLNDNVVFKFDYQDQQGTANDDGYNLGVGFHF